MASGGGARENRLALEKSPYLLQHAANPVDWFPWGAEAFAKAAAENKPIFLSVGYSTCHWCHVMERESFECEETGALLNRHFVSVKVDREERPDVDKLYMTFIQVSLSLLIEVSDGQVYGGDVGERGLADERVPDAGRGAHHRRHLLPARGPLRQTRLPHHPQAPPRLLPQLLPEGGGVPIGT